MNDSISVTLDRIISISQARANLPLLLKKVKKKNFFVLTRRNKPQAVLVDLKLLSKLMNVYQRWQREQDFTILENIRRSIPPYPEKEVQKDIAQVLKTLRSKK